MVKNLHEIEATDIKHIHLINISKTGQFSLDHNSSKLKENQLEAMYKTNNKKIDQMLLRLQTVINKACLGKVDIINNI
jgi:hypothetical protein